jgi:alcohol dehydrogenase class IV
VTDEPNLYMESARLLKAIRLARSARELGVTAEHVAADPTVQAAVAAHAHPATPPSKITWAQVVTILQEADRLPGGLFAEAAK